MAEAKKTKEPLIKVLASDKRVAALDFIKLRADRRTRRRIEMELEAREEAKLEEALQSGEITLDEVTGQAKK
ncbi:hypothetical protein [Mycoplasmopsis arginini]|jgi:hypothetical protein|uniref:Uncharacterized protein n=1 Tax=Mycoplasmopsis arginini TaxID=2094 RepID=A0AA43R0Y0_MYCAR|nr:hypothetical protein [Mycoplasmopsis arginini]MDI3349482.1 hypothetical protein [Mycoplasmopsis arginini]